MTDAKTNPVIRSPEQASLGQLVHRVQMRIVDRHVSCVSQQDARNKFDTGSPRSTDVVQGTKAGRPAQRRVKHNQILKVVPEVSCIESQLSLQKRLLPANIPSAAAFRQQIWITVKAKSLRNGRHSKPCPQRRMQNSTLRGQLPTLRYSIGLGSSRHTRLIPPDTNCRRGHFSPIPRVLQIATGQILPLGRQDR